jgi:hypothetical protein
MITIRLRIVNLLEHYAVISYGDQNKITSPFKKKLTQSISYSFIFEISSNDEKKTTHPEDTQKAFVTNYAYYSDN